MVDRSEQWKRYEKWQQKEDVWKEVFSGQQKDSVDWEAQLLPHPFVEPERPESDYLLGQALLSVKMRFKPLLYFTTTVAGVFLYGFAVTQYVEDLWLYGLVGSMSALATFGLLGWRRVMMKRAEEKVVLFKRKLEEEYLKNKEQALKEHETKEQERICRIKALLNGENDVIQKVAYDHLVEAANWPLGVSFRPQGISAKVLELTITVPGLEMINQENASWDEAKGVVQFSTKSLQESLRHYERLVAAIVLRAGCEVFRVCPTLQEIYVSVVTGKYSDTMANSLEACILSTILTRVKFQTMDFAKMDYLNALENFELRYAPGANFPGKVQPFSASKQPSELLYLDLTDLDSEKLETVVNELVRDTQARKPGWEDGQETAQDFAE